MAGHLRYQHHWIFCIAALIVWLALGWPYLGSIAEGSGAVSPLWLGPYAIFGASVLTVIVLKLRPGVQWALLSVELGAVVAMAAIYPRAMMALFLVIIAWQVALATAPFRALAWIAAQTLIVIGTLALAPKPDLCWILGLSLALQLFFLFTAQTARALAQTNRELRSAQAIIANAARDAERLRISRELHDAWGHELTALGLQLEIASHVIGAGQANEHVAQAKGLTRDLLAKVRNVVAALREAESCDVKDALEALARKVPSPAIHVDFAPGVQVAPDQAHALIRCAQEAVTNAVRHSHASNLWFQVAQAGDGVRFVARNDGGARPVMSPPGTGLQGMRERLEHLGGRLGVQFDAGSGFTIEVWLPAQAPQGA